MTVARHQANHARLQALRAEADALEEQLKSSVAALAGLRRELSETPATVFPANSRPVPFDELLQYAKSISKYTVPPTFRERALDADGEGGGVVETTAPADLEPHHVGTDRLDPQLLAVQVRHQAVRGLA